MSDIIRLLDIPPIFPDILLKQVYKKSSYIIIKFDFQTAKFNFYASFWRIYKTTMDNRIINFVSQCFLQLRQEIIQKLFIIGKINGLHKFGKKQYHALRRLNAVWRRLVLPRKSGRLDAVCPRLKTSWPSFPHTTRFFLSSL